MSNQSNAIQLFRTTDKQVLSLTTAENREEIFISINSNRVNIDRKVFKKNAKDRSKMRWLKKKLKPQLGKSFSNKLV